jgi:hypothetical protein
VSHKSGHVIVNIATPVQVAGVKTHGGVVAVGLLVAGFIVGALLF